jgi:mRNA interferase RelE/StbE
MRYEIVLAPSAVAELTELRADIRGRVRDAIELHLRHEPTRLSRSRIKRLRGLERPQYRLRVDEVRVFYDVAKGTVQVLAVVSKAQAEDWLQAHGASATKGGSGGGQG